MATLMFGVRPGVAGMRFLGEYSFLHQENAVASSALLRKISSVVYTLCIWGSYAIVVAGKPVLEQGNTVCVINN